MRGSVPSSEGVPPRAYGTGSFRSAERQPGGGAEEERDVEQARTYYAQLVRAKMIKEPEAELQALKFKPVANAGDPDEVAPLIRHMSGE